ncbi:hypothetical protein [Domibacillus indicus]|uniref:hypothetical protein n=1 Tax=Domibacillus indicus TaxID=1437523 RepID=UPI0006181371|nr:hypothetical protein [Domibacillus indicus]
MPNYDVLFSFFPFLAIGLFKNIRKVLKAKGHEDFKKLISFIMGDGERFILCGSAFFTLFNIWWRLFFWPSPALNDWRICRSLH